MPRFIRARQCGDTIYHYYQSKPKSVTDFRARAVCLTEINVTFTGRPRAGHLPSLPGALTYEAYPTYCFFLQQPPRVPPHYYKARESVGSFDSRRVYKNTNIVYKITQQKNSTKTLFSDTINRPCHTIQSPPLFSAFATRWHTFF